MLNISWDAPYNLATYLEQEIKAELNYQLCQQKQPFMAK